MVNVTIVDDEDLSRGLIRSMVEEYCPDFEIVSESSNMMEACDQILRFRPDLVFLDIEMPEGNAFDLIAEFQNRRFFQIILVSAYEKYARRAIRAHVFDYLLKPVDDAEFRKATWRFKASLEARKDHEERQESPESIIVPNINGFRMIDPNEIVHLEADNNYTRIYLMSGERLLASQTLGKFEKGLPDKWFIRIHRSHIINLHHLKEFLSVDGGYALMRNDHKVSISHKNLEVFRRAVDRMGKKL